MIIQYNRMLVYKRATVAVVYGQNQSTYMKSLETDREINTICRGPFYWHGLSLIPEWVSNYIHKVWDEITYPFPYLGLGMTSNFILHFTERVITYPCWD